MGRAARLAVTICGPTACGKTDLALAVARELPAEIVSVDSVLVYQGMDIGAAKPSPEIRRAVPHHLIDIRDPSEHYSAGEFARDARRAIEAILSRSAVPVLVGGTMLYFKALQEGLAALPKADWTWRDAIDAEARARGWPALHRRLARVDPEAAARISPADPQRIQRALEVYHLTGRPISTFHAGQPVARAVVDYVNVALIPSDRAALAERIAARFDAMLAAGLVTEVRALYERGDLGPRTPAIRAVGYRQIWNHVAGRCSLEEARRAAITATRRLAKRQLTWLRTRQDRVRFEPGDPEALRWIVAQVRAAGDAGEGPGPQPSARS